MLQDYLLTIIGVLSIYFLYYYKKIHWKFDAGGLKYIKGVPVFGNVLQSTFYRRHFTDDMDAVYRAFPDERYVGFIEGTRPAILVRDPDLMKDIVIKDHLSFNDRKQFFPERLDSLLGRSLIVVNGLDWKRMRANLNPAFTANKLKYMMTKMQEVAQKVVENLKVSGQSELDIQTPMYQYTSEGCMYSAIGVRDTNKDYENNVFVELSSTLNVSSWIRFIYYLSIEYPKIGGIIHFFGINLFPKKTTNFFKNVVTEAIEHRQKNNIVQQDFLQVLSEYYNEWSIEEIAGQIFFNFVASSETATHTLSLCFHELALNPEIQETLYQEIRTHKESEGTLNYDNMKNLKYLECVLNETMRKWTASIVMDRICTKPYLLPPPREGGKPYLVQPGDIVLCVVNPVHNDPQYHPEPHVFNPDRFSDENKQSIKPCTFMPFGMGARSCIGGRFARLLMMTMIYHLVLNFKICRCDKTADPITVIPDQFIITCADGSWVKLEIRSTM